MTSAPIQADLMQWWMLRTRRQRVEVPRGLDAVANRWLARLRHARIGTHYLRKEAEAVVAQERQWAELSEGALSERLEELRAAFARRKETLEQVRAAFAAVREVAWRTTGERPFMVQIMGALGLYHGQIVEMVTGEGKTLTASLTATVLAWRRKPVHVVTVNDYLAQRDADSRNPIYRRCGLEAAALTNEMPEPERALAYQKPILYATAKEIMADWLRDQLKLGQIADPVSTRWRQGVLWNGTEAGRAEQGRARRVGTLVPGLFVAIVDEIDAILIDEAVTPLIIAMEQGANPQAEIYRRACQLAEGLVEEEDFRLRRAERQAELTSRGWQRVQEQLKPEDHPVFRAPRRCAELVEQALVARHCYLLGQHYQIIDGKVVIVDEYTGRLMPDRQWQHGLHQAVEAKENLEITADRQTLAAISFQRFFRQYRHLCGMTGTAAEASPELEATYGLPVRIIPTNRPVQRQQWPDRIYRSQEEKWKAIAREVARLHAQGRPVLIGTRSVRNSELLSDLLKEMGLEHQVLNAIHHKREAEIVALAGQRGAITVATNMAGRGTDIKLGPGVAELGGLHVILSERHTAGRIDRQFIGRAGRQGDPGSAQIFMSLEDELLVHYLPRTARLLQGLFARKNKSQAPHTPPGISEKATNPEEKEETLPAWVGLFFQLAQRVATRRALKTRLLLIRHEDELDRSLPG